MKLILYFFPDNVTEPDAGNKARALGLLKYFRYKNFSVDFVSIKNEQAALVNEHTESELLSAGLANKVYLLSRKPKGNNPVSYFLKYKLWDLFYYLFTYPVNSAIPTYLTVALKRGFRQILKTNSYDHIIISYVHSADLISDKQLTGNANTIIDTHDFLTAQFKDKRGFNLGATFADEIERLNTFNEIWAISPEEEYIFNQFCRSQVRWVPMMLDEPALDVKDINERKYDLVYVGNDNVHNITAINWFFEQVYPLLRADIKLCVIGRINNHISESYKKIDRVSFAEDLSSYYNNSKIAVCPMLNGTGIKVKVVEALAYGLPVVCTPRGIDGLPNKQNNGCLVSDDAAGFAGHIMALLNNYELYKAQSNYAKATFEGNFSSRATYQLLDKAFI
ncbi:glycosyltransferase family 4 protein [Mucilaginibacter sp. 14171R-50]|uniref:glycosyltransferase n=1 Tax=Mucilaginibacter sp. 14171R-50 TaxID=2703789 RepID=UPI00138C5A3F|nr:glycosyltransferase [Mucilaginibacter sp. 14171R-50]QHS54724.1 glycosyltransferase family 4 protein [Mucilaginibacter sp. 14171R-50]